MLDHVLAYLLRKGPHDDDAVDGLVGVRAFRILTNSSWPVVPGSCSMSQAMPFFSAIFFALFRVGQRSPGHRLRS